MWNIQLNHRLLRVFKAAIKEARGEMCPLKLSQRLTLSHFRIYLCSGSALLPASFCHPGWWKSWEPHAFHITSDQKLWKQDGTLTAAVPPNSPPPHPLLVPSVTAQSLQLVLIKHTHTHRTAKRPSKGDTNLNLFIFTRDAWTDQPPIIVWQFMKYVIGTSQLTPVVADHLWLILWCLWLCNTVPPPTLYKVTPCGRPPKPNNMLPVWNLYKVVWDWY